MTPNERLLLHAIQDIGLADRSSHPTHPRVIGAYKRAAHWFDEGEPVAWGSLIMSAWCSEVGLPYPRSPKARAWLAAPADKLGIVRVCAPSELHQGDLIVWTRGSSPTRGHVSIYMGHQNPHYIWAFGGNFAHVVNVARYPPSRFLAGIRFVSEPAPRAPRTN